MDIDPIAIARQIQIDLITDNSNPIIDYFKDLWSELSVVETHVYHTDGGERIYYKNVGNLLKQWIFYQNDRDGKFWVNFDNYWEILEVRFNLNYTEAQIITQTLVRIALGNNNVKPCSTWRGVKIDNSLNSVVDIPLPDAKHFLQSSTINTVLYNL